MYPFSRILGKYVLQMKWAISDNIMFSWYGLLFCYYDIELTGLRLRTRYNIKAVPCE